MHQSTDNLQPNPNPKATISVIWRTIRARTHMSFSFDFPLLKAKASGNTCSPSSPLFPPTVPNIVRKRFDFAKMVCHRPCHAESGRSK